MGGCCAGTTRRCALFAAHHGEEVTRPATGSLWASTAPTRRSLRGRHPAAARRPPQQHGFAPQVRIGLHASDAAQVGGIFRGKGVHEAARIVDVAEGGEIVASPATVGASSPYPASEARTVTLKGLSEPMEVVSIDWR